ncbi:MAG: hypothetical protein IJA10_11760 [Lachnospiraceae bacterium]|nr:hypothetical protein [Lachnospiraceae bacterium]
MARKNSKNKKRKVGKQSHPYLISAVATFIIGVILYYFLLPPLNISSVASWIFFGGLFIAYVVVSSIANAIITDTLNETKMQKQDKILFYVIGAGLLVFIIGAIASSKLFQASTYANLLQVEEYDFEEVIPESEEISDIALMDTASAQIVGDRAIGSLSDVVSQFVVGENYSQIAFNGKPLKISSLEYAGFFKYLNNKSEGIPGYVSVDPVTNDAKYVKLEQNIQYTESAYFGKDLRRKLRFSYPTAIFEGYHFEVDEEGNPYYICPIVKKNAGLFGAEDIKAIVIFDPITGESEKYDVGEIPEWVDRVYDGDLLQNQYDSYGTLQKGFWNSCFGKSGCKKTTEDYGYKVIGNDVWIYTGVTSVAGDESNIGFVLMNSRTKESKYVSVAGAEEFSAMAAAEGQVQHLGYVASFPSLVNIDGQATYIMVLKDNGGLVKMYAMVNVEKYNLVATGSTQAEVLTAYETLLHSSGMVQKEQVDLETKASKTIEIKEIQYITLSGETIVYIKDSEGNVYKQNFAENENLILLSEGDKVKVIFEEGDEDISTLYSFEMQD